MNLSLERHHALGKIVAEIAQNFGIHKNALALHLGQNANQRALQSFVGGGQFLFAQAWLQKRIKPARDVGIFGSVGSGFVQRHLVEGDLFFAAAADV